MQKIYRESKMKYYVIFNGYEDFKVLKVIFSTYKKVWDYANEHYLNESHYDVFGGWATKEEMCNYLANNQ